MSDRIPFLEQRISTLRKQKDRYKKRIAELEQRLAAAESRNVELENALKQARECAAEWAVYASDYFQKKYDLAGDLAAIDRVLNKANAPEVNGE